MLAADQHQDNYNPVTLISTNNAATMDLADFGAVPDTLGVEEVRAALQRAVREGCTDFHPRQTLWSPHLMCRTQSTVLTYIPIVPIILHAQSPALLIVMRLTHTCVISYKAW